MMPTNLPTTTTNAPSRSPTMFTLQSSSTAFILGDNSSMNNTDEISIISTPSVFPSDIPTVYPTLIPTIEPSINPTDIIVPSVIPSSVPTIIPSETTMIPSIVPSVYPTITLKPSYHPSETPTNYPTTTPTETELQIALDTLCIRKGRYCCEESMGGRKCVINILASLCQWYYEFDEFETLDYYMMKNSDLIYNNESLIVVSNFPFLGNNTNINDDKSIAILFVLDLSIKYKYGQVDILIHMK